MQIIAHHYLRTIAGKQLLQVLLLAIQVVYQPKVWALYIFI